MKGEKGLKMDQAQKTKVAQNLLKHILVLNF